jgi:hypothetical protein
VPSPGQQNLQEPQELEVPKQQGRSMLHKRHSNGCVMHKCSRSSCCFTVGKLSCLLRLP